MPLHSEIPLRSLVSSLENAASTGFEVKSPAGVCALATMIGPACEKCNREENKT